MIFDITPYSTEKNIGKAYNERIALLPDDAWVIIRDGDCMYLTPDYGFIIEDIIAKYGEEYALIGALTNRLGNTELLYNQQFSEDTDVRNHYEIAMKIRGDQETVKTDICAGFFMMFKKETWVKVGGFTEILSESRYVDKRFSGVIKANGLKIGIAQNLYLFHGYRIWEKEHKKAWNSTEHLK